MKYTGILFSLILLMNSGVEAQDDGPASKTYQGPEGMTLTIVPLEPENGERQALVQLMGHPYFGSRKIFLARVISGMGRESYDTLKTSKPYTIARRDHSYTDPYFSVPKMNQIGEYIFVYPRDEAKAKPIQVNGADVVAAYFSRRKASSPAGRDTLVKEADKELQNSASDMRNKCSGDIALTGDWKSFPDKVLEDYDAALLCRKAVAGLVRVCQNALGKEAVKEKIAAVECTYGEPAGASLSGKTLRLNVNSTSGETEEAIEQYLLNSL